MSDPQVTRRHRSWATLVSLASVAATALGSIASTASAAAIQYTMTWNQVSGSYGSTSFTNETITLTFDYDTNNVTPLASFYQAVFANGAGISVTLGSGGSILNDAALDAVAQNNSGLVANGSFIYFGTSNGTQYTSDRGYLGTFASAPGAAVDWLTTEWSSTASVGGNSTNWAPGETPLVINGLELALNVATSTNGGSWGSTLTPPSAVPGTGLAGLATLGLAGVARRRRR